MERKQIANVLVPAAAVAAIIALVALVFVAGGSDETAKKKEAVPTAGTPSAAGMGESKPPLDAPEWKDIGDGLKVWDVKEGTGDPVQPGASVTAHYTGWLTNGEVFDMHALTAAHPTLPIPSYAYVTNLSNNRTILVRINDRGPYVGERMIDLSKGSADVLGLRGRGTGRVRVRYAGPAPLNGDDGRERGWVHILILASHGANHRRWRVRRCRGYAGTAWCTRRPRQRLRAAR